MRVRCVYKELVDIKDLRPHPKHRNRHPKKQIEALANIVRETGWRRCLTISNRSGYLTVGRGRMMVAEYLNEKYPDEGWNMVPADRQDYDSEAQEYADVQADNAIALWAELDIPAIKLDIKEFPELKLELLGIEKLQAISGHSRLADDDIPEVVKNSRVRRGEIWQLGRHRLMCGDSTAITDVEKLMAGERADMVFTDPPYGMRLDAEGFKNMPKAKGTTAHDYKNVIGDHEDFKPELINTVLGAFSYCAEIFLWGADYYAELLPERNDGSWIVWDKRQEGGTDKLFGSSFELCWSKAKHKRDIARVLWAGYFGMSGEDSKTRIHPTQKPTKLVEWFFERWGEARTNVVDLFGGSGSTLIACEKTNRRCFMMEIDPHYCEVILTRWEKYTGVMAERIGG